MASPVPFHDLELEVGLAADGSREVRLLEPRGPVAPFSLPPGFPSGSALLQQMDASLKQEEGPEPLPPGLGASLFAGLLPGPVEERFRHLCQARAEAQVRLRLTFEGGALQGLRPEEADFPWEGLVDPRTGQCLHQLGVPLVRYLDMPVGIRRFEVRPPLRVLLVAAEPPSARKGLAGALSTVDQELELVHAVLEASPHFIVERLEPPTFAELQHRLLDGGFHILHFIGHGDFDHESGSGGLLLEDGGGDEDGDSVWASELAPVVGASRTLRLVVLNSCSSGMIAGRDGHDPLEGFAAALLEEGLPALVGMRFCIRHDAAKDFARIFYEVLVETGQVDAAAVAARAALFENKVYRRYQQWLVPALFSRAAHGRIFDVGPPSEASAPTRVGVRSFFGWGTALEEWSDHFLPLTVYFRGRAPKPKVDWQGTLHPRLTSFLDEATVGQGPLHLDFAAHGSLAFATGYYLEAKSDHGYTVRQRGILGTEDWQVARPEAGRGYPGWKVVEHEVPGGGEDVALAVSSTNPTISDVEAYVKSSLPSVGTIVEAVGEGGASQFSVQDGPHALLLATELRRLLSSKPGNWQGTFHVFFAGPNALMFTLGCLCRGPFRIQLYEFDFDGRENRSYTPSLCFPPP